MNGWVDFKNIKQAVGILAVIEHYGVKLKKSGRELRGRCPIHQGDGADSFHANTEKNAFHCFSCQAKGNVLDFVAAMEHCSVRDAALKLQQWFTVAPIETPASKTETADAGQLATEKAGDGGETNKPLSFTLRGIDHRHSYLTSRGIDPETAEYFGAGFFAGKGSMSGRVVIPIHNSRGELVAYAGRSVNGSEPRYKLPGGFQKSAELYNLHRAIAGDCRGLIVVEGYFDAMKVHQAGYPFVVALMGCSMSDQQADLLVTHADQVLVMLDGDIAGRQGTDHMLAQLGKRVWTKAVLVPEGRQPDQLSAEELRQLLVE